MPLNSVFRFGLETTYQDFRFAFRQLKKNFGFTFTAIVVLALGMAASVSIFAFVDAALIRPLPYRDSSQLVGAYESTPLSPQNSLSYQDYLDWKARNTVFSSLETYVSNDPILTTSEGAEALRTGRVSDGFFRVLGVKPILGRDFSSGEDQPSAPRAVLLPYSTWQNRYGGRQDVLGKSVTLDGAPSVIIGVLPQEFHFTPVEPAEFWETLHLDRGCDTHRACRFMYGVARLKDGISLQTATAEVTSIAEQLEKEYPDTNRGRGATLLPLTDVILGNVRPILLVLLGGAMLLLLIAGINVASLLLVRSEARKREIAVRLALGASSSRLIRQFVAEATVIVIAAATLSLAIAELTMQLLIHLIPAGLIASMPFLRGIGLQPRVLVFLVAVSLLAGILFSLTPTGGLAFLSMRQGLTEGSRGSAGTTWRRLGSKLVVLELATAVILLVGAGLLGKSLYRLLHVNVGVRPENLATLEVLAPNIPYEKDESAALGLERNALREIADLPGVRSVALATVIPLTIWNFHASIRVLGRPWHGEHNEVSHRGISTNYFATMGSKLMRGRSFREDEDKSKPRVAIVNQALARQYFPGEDPIGKQLSYLSDPPVPIEIVGIVEDMKEGQLDKATVPVMYIPSSSRKLFHVSSADVTAGGNRPGPDGCRDTKDRSRGHNSEWYDHERQDRSLSDCLSAPIVRVAGGWICVPGVVAQRRRAVRCNCIFRVAANPRNWDSHGAGGADGQRLSNDFA
jgi:macrolide transport system ATP-binding/permease protein